MLKKKEPQKAKRIPAGVARAQFGRILDRAAHRHERFVVTKNGEATAVILGIEDFLQVTVKTPDSLAALQEEAAKNGMADLSWEEIEAEIEAVRQAKTQRTT